MRGLSRVSIPLLALCACSNADPDDGGTAHRARLQPLTSCNDVASQVRVRALRQMNKRLDEAMAQALESAKQGCGRPRGQLSGPVATTGTAGAAPNAAPPPAAESARGSASSYSGTNNQVAGVDEADFIKNDGTYIYVAQGSSLRIVQAWPPATASTVAKVAVEGEARRLFVTQSHALVYSSLPPPPAAGGGQGPGSTARQAPGSVARPGGSVPGRAECTYGYDCDFTGDGRPSKLTVFDIRDRRAPVLVREITSSGSYVNARRIGSAVFTVLTARQDPFADLATWPTDLPGCGISDPEAVIRDAFQRLRARHRAVIEQTPLGSILPTLRQTIHPPGGPPRVSEDPLADCGGFYAETLGDGDAFTTVLALDMDGGEELQTATVYSRPGAVYASSAAMYLAVPHDRRESPGWFEGQRALEQVSTVHRFDVAAAGTPAVTYVASGLIKGRVLNQFAMDELDGFLRVATTTGRVPDPQVHSTLSVLGAGEGGLEIVGQVDQLAPGEDIRSVRFDADRGYVVTFKKTDPLFVFDLSDPRAPRVEAELKIPGFSTYMHRMDRNHLLTIGYDAADQGNFAYFTGVLLQVFDVTDPRQPTLKHKQVIGTRGSSSEALTNHLAFTYFAPRDLLLLPMTVCELPPGNNNLFGARPTFSGLIAYNVTTAGGFREDGRVSHPAGAGVTCGNWWTSASSQVKRSIVMDDWVFSVSGTQIKVNRLDALAADVTSVPLE